MVALNRPAERDYRSVESYIFDKKPLVDEEYGFVYQKEDLITLRDGRETAFLDTFTEKMLQTFHCSLLQVSPKPSSVKNISIHGRENLSCGNDAQNVLAETLFNLSPGMEQ